MSFRGFFFSLVFIWVNCFRVELAVDAKQFYPRKGYNRVSPCLTIIVDPSGHGNFSTIQSAIDSVSSNNKNWVCINVKAGTYREKVNIPKGKSYIILQGEGKKKTLVDWDDHATTLQSPTFSTMADNVVVKSISFRNSYNGPIIIPAVAAMVSGDKSYFYRVGFFGVQDTLWDDKGKHYFELCTIQGAVDFIFGTGQSLYERCSISVIGAALRPGVSGFITAQGRTNESEGNGFVFKNCNIFGSGKSYLGRAWRDYARVIFYNTSMSNVILPSGWDPWHSYEHRDLITFAEYGNFGPGSDISKRVNWTKKLDFETIKKMTSISFIDTEGWLKRRNNHLQSIYEE